MKAPDKHRRAYVRPSKGHSEARQIKAVIGAGASHVYVDGKAKPSREIDGATVIWLPDARARWLKSIREGDEVIVATSGRIGSTRGDIAIALTDIHKRGAVLVEASTNRRSNIPADAPMLMLDAVNELTYDRGKLFTSKTGAEAAAKSTRRRGERMPVPEARPIWKDVAKYPLVDDALAEMWGWLPRVAYKYLGPRHVPGSHGGRPRKTKTD